MISTSPNRVLMIGLDAFEMTLADEMMKRNELPNLRRLRDRSARFRLDHGYDKFSGLAWEHVSSGIAPSDGGRWSAVNFDPERYSVRQHLTSTTPFFANLPFKTVIMDVPYCDLSKAPNAFGFVDWGAHDPGIPPMTRPLELADQITARVGPYPAKDSIYGFCWHSISKTQKLARDLQLAISARFNLARWMLSDKFSDWRLGILVVSEPHSAIEPLWHGIDSTHPLHNLPSAPAAKMGLENIYRTIDTSVGELIDDFPEVTVALFSMHGMGSNEADVAAMMLLPELLYRHAFGKPYARLKEWPDYLPDGTPLVAEDASWELAMEEIVPPLISQSNPSAFNRFLQYFRLAKKQHGFFEKIPEEGLAIDWMPATRYRTFWPKMRAFALPSFYDGRIRINLQARESQGIVPIEQYEAVCDGICALLHECTNSLTGEPIVKEIIRVKKDPLKIDACEADLSVIFKSMPLGLSHPKLGTIGPYPWRRTGGHTGENGFIYLAGTNLQPGDYGVRSSFDVVPSILGLLGEESLGFSGTALAGR